MKPRNIIEAENRMTELSEVSKENSIRSTVVRGTVTNLNLVNVEN